MHEIAYLYKYLHIRGLMPSMQQNHSMPHQKGGCKCTSVDEEPRFNGPLKICDALNAPEPGPRRTPPITCLKSKSGLKRRRRCCK
jgi:hypothetical protein